METLERLKEAEQLAFDDVLREFEAEVYGDGLCPNRDLCFRCRLNVSEAAIEDGWRCAFEEHHNLWQCHLSGMLRMEETL